MGNSFPPLSPGAKEDASNGASSRYVLPETTLLMVLGLLDMLTTIFFLATGQAREANPLFDGILHTFGPIGFIAFKALLLGGPLTLAEWARKRNEPFVRSALRLGILLYVGLYLINFLRFNLPHFLQ
jgi:hypothetical protein